jgi:endonuclease YncB( thermonuclease family)
MRKRTALLAGILLFICAFASAQTVYITKSGNKYHVAGCRYLAKSSIPIDLADAVARGFSPCSVCNPPRLQKAKEVPAPAASRTAAASRAPKEIRQLLGEVVAVHDGDTLTLLVGTTQHKIRLNGIDAPELGQAFGSRARQFLSGLCFGKTVTVRVVDIDRYGREVGDVYVNGVFVNAELVRAGMAWHYKQYSKDAKLAALENEARSGKRGLWADARPVAPWKYRKE